ncbi:hypothetical protein [Geothrix sp. 21YS21S-4]|uniref:hypothetical protein n=1 Tax=Geothrix sp. 21YS21S-4 TaxID=3068889 RepID=UPI0027BB0066|nr:hypothetical protein [Geothrix sp. 21YS21S-4]
MPAAAEQELRFLEAYDWEQPLPEAPKGPRHASLQWLRVAAAFDPEAGLPPDPFPSGAAHREAGALRMLLAAGKEEWAGRLATQPLRQSGTALALWRWGQRQVRNGRFPADMRRLWEDRLLAAGPALTRGYALRHALCWALAERDEARFAAIKDRAPAGSEAVVGGFQRLFGLLDAPSPDLRLWDLAGLDYADLRLDQLGAARVWICPADDALPDLPPDVAWIIPSAGADLDERGASLTEGVAQEAAGLAARLRAAGKSARFAPSRVAFETLGLSWFPILIELDSRGNVRSIRMGDAAPRRP